MIGRREFITLLGGAAAWPVAARAQQPARMRRVGVLMSPREDDLEAQTRASALRKGLAELGWTEGRNIHIDFRWSGGDAPRANAYAAELVSLMPDVIIANSTLCLKAVRNETSTIPIVFVVVGDPVGAGFVSSLAHPGGNVTGFTAFEFEIGSKWLEIATAIAPDVRRIAFIFNPEAGLPYAEKFSQSIAGAAPARRIELIVSPVRNVAEVDHAIARVGSNSDSGLIVNPDAFTIANRGLIISLAARYRLPAIYAYKYFAVDGGLLSYGHETNDLFERATIYVDKIFKGAKPADLPVQNPTKFELVINQKTAKALGLTIPDKLLALADEVIE
jgi:putative tryptophan/tyrosine transport system substrate-binding protein